jgi:hypothetical protein
MSTDLTKAPPKMEDFLPENLPDREREVEAEVAEAKAKAEVIQVTNEAEARVALEFLKEVKRGADAIEAERVSLTKPRKDAAEEIKRRYDVTRAPFLAVEQEARSKLDTFTAEQERIQREAEEKARREAEERERIAREERSRQEAAATEAAQKAKENAEAARELVEEDGSEEAAELAAEEQIRAHEARVAESAIQGLPEPSMPVPVVPSAPKLDGFTKPKRWVATVVDFDALPDKLPDGTPLKVVDESALRRWMLAQVKENGGVAPGLPGAEFKQVETTAVRT